MLNPCPCLCTTFIILSIAVARLTPGYWWGWGVTRVRVGWPLGTAGRRGGYMGYKNSHLSCMWEQESELDAVYRINCVGPESLFLVEWGALSRRVMPHPWHGTALHCCPWSRNIHQLLSNSPDIVLQCSLAANTEGKQIIISLWYLLSGAFNAMP